MPLPLLLGWGAKLLVAGLIGAAAVGIAGLIYYSIKARITAKNAKNLLEKTSSEIGQRLRTGEYNTVNAGLTVKDVDTDSDGNTYVAFEDEYGNLAGLKSSNGTSLDEGDTILIE